METLNIFKKIRLFFEAHNCCFKKKNNVDSSQEIIRELIDGHMALFSYAKPRLNIEADSQRIYQRIYDEVTLCLENAGFELLYDYQGDNIHNFKVTVAPHIKDPVVTVPAIISKNSKIVFRLGQIVFPTN